jgi:uncharacterized ferritin-like protein (DUF455 family)
VYYGAVSEIKKEIPAYTQKESEAMPVKSADEMLKSTVSFLDKLRKAVAQLEEMKRRLEGDAEFRKLWETNSAAALRQVGINPDARMEVGLEAYEKGPRCDWCVTPNGNACHC